MVPKSFHFRWAIPLLLWITAAAYAGAQTAAPVASRVTQAVNNLQRVTLSNSVSARIAAAKDLGSLTGSHALTRMMLVLKRSDEQQKALDTLVAAQHQKGSASYRKWLTPAEFQSRFAPSTADLAQITGWLQAQGFSNVKVAPGGQRIEFDGAAATVESAFQTSMHKFQVSTTLGTEVHIANKTAISIPQALSPVVAGVVSLHNFQSRPAYVSAGLAKRNANGKLERVNPNTTVTDGNGNYGYYLSPADIKTIYGANPLPSSVDGTGVSIAIIGRTSIRLSDLQAFRDIFSLPAKDPNVILTGPDPGEVYGDIGESSLDLEWAGALAPNATLNFVTAASTDTTDGISLAAAYAVENVVSPIISLSYGACEQTLGDNTNLFMKLLWQQAAAEGISVFVSSGDSAAAGCDVARSGSPSTIGEGVNGLASTPYNVAVGGTQFAEGSLADLYWDSNNGANLSSAIGYIPEYVWNQSCDPSYPSSVFNCVNDQTYTNIFGGGGGPSRCVETSTDGEGNVTCLAGYPKPSWQKGAGVPDDSVRDIPDVSFNASGLDDPYMFCYQAACEYTKTTTGVSVNSIALAGGTSISTPVMAGIMALVEQQNGTFLGLPNYNLYNLAAQDGESCTSVDRNDPTQPASCIFNDITVGNNGAPGLPGYGTDTPDFTATAGYDLATGLGSINIANLVNKWKNGDASSATSTTLTVPTTQAVHGSALEVSVKVASSGGTPTGDVGLKTGSFGGVADQITLGADGSWSGTIKDLPGGTYQLTAHYTGDTAFSSSDSSAVSLTITPEDSKPSFGAYIVSNNALAPVSGTYYLGYPIYYKGTVAGLSGQGTPSGAVDIVADGSTIIASTTLTADGGFLIGTSALTVGTHSITVRYAGDNSFNASTSDPVEVVIGQGETATYTSLYGVASVGGTVTLASTVSNSGGEIVEPTGTVTFYDSGTAIGTANVVYEGPQGSGVPQAVISYTFATSGMHALNSLYNGDSNYAVSTAINQLRISPDTPQGNTPTTTTLTMTSAAALTPGQVARFMVTVKSQDSTVTTVPAGSVYLLQTNNAGDIFYVNPLSNGVLAADAYVYGPGTYTLKAYYPGNSTFQTSTSANTVTFTVSKLNPATTFTAGAAYALPNTQTTLNFRSYPTQLNSYITEDATGSVTFTDVVNGGTPVVLGTYSLLQVAGDVGGYSGRFVLPAGTNVITATYSGNAIFNSTSSTATVVVTDPDFVVSAGQTALTMTAGTSATGSLTITPVLQYIDSVALTCSSGVPAGSTCSITPNSAPLNGTAVTATVTLSVPAPSPSATSAKVSPAAPWLSGGFVLAGMVFLWPRRRKIAVVLPVVMAAAMIGLWGCGGSSGAPKSTLLALSSSSIKAPSGTALTLTADLSALANAPTGTVTFYDGTKALGTATVESGVASFQTSSLAVGAHAITAQYGGDAHNAGSTSLAITQVVTGTTTLQITATSSAVTHMLPIAVTVN